VNCNRSAITAAALLAPTGIRIPAEPNMLIPTPATGNTFAQAIANRTGNNSGPTNPADAAPRYAARNLSSIATIVLRLTS
jgi:hypothetical protein